MNPESGRGIENKPEEVSLRQAKSEDLDFLYTASIEGMRPVHERLNPGEVQDEDAARAKYESGFDPEKIQVIQFNGQDAGRLRVVRSPESIYVGGIQLLPEFQGKGIGTKIFTDLKQESDISGVPIVLEVHDVNEEARRFYASLGFAEGDKIPNKTILTYNPKSSS